MDFSDEIHLALAFKILPLLREILPPLPPISSSFQVCPILPTGFSTDTARPVFSSALLCSSTSTSLTLFWKPPQMYARTEMHRSSANWTLQPHFQVPQRSQLYHWMPQKLLQETTFWEYLGTAGSFFLILTTEGYASAGTGTQRYSPDIFRGWCYFVCSFYFNIDSYNLGCSYPHKCWTS